MNANAIRTDAAYSIYNAGVFDVLGIWRLERACFPKDAYDLLTLLNLVMMPNMLRFKSVANDQVVGFLAAEYHRYDQTGWIVTVGVSPHYEGRGIGRALLDCAEKHQWDGVERMKLTVRRRNERAIELYRRCGYQWVGTYRGYYHDGEDGLIMEKNLTHP
jgi:ribosomal protein S18 acetylase RimI-like enzyme